MRTNISILALGLFSAALAAPAFANVELVTLPPRDTVQLTIYNSADLTLVRERRHLTLRKGENRLQFSWAGTLIDPTSVELRPVTHPDQVTVLDTTFPANLPNNLVWHIQSEVEGDAQVEIIYFTSGISWAADYVIEAAPDENTMSLTGYVTVHNRSGEDYPNAETRLVVGTINLVQPIADLARGGRRAEMRLMRDAVSSFEMANGLVGASMSAPLAKPKQIIKEGLSEYFLYSVEGRETIPDQWSKRLRSFHVEGVPLEVEYRVDPNKWRNTVQKFFTVKNSEENSLGKEPLPNGRVMAFRRLAKDERLVFAGQSTVKYVPVGEDIEVNLGQAPDVGIEIDRMRFRKAHIRFNNVGNVAGYDTIETFRLRLRNGTPRRTTWEIRLHHHNDWTWKGRGPITRENVTTLLIEPDVAGNLSLDITYKVTTSIGDKVGARS